MATLNLQDYALNDLSNYKGSKSTEQISGSTPGAMQYADGGRASMMPPTIPTAPATPTVGSIMGTKPTADSLMQQALAIQAQIPTATGYTKKPNIPTPEAMPEDPWKPMTPAEERRIQREQMALFQKEIDATNQIYDEMIRQEQLAGQGRLGSVGAMGARAGILGSDFQGAQEESTRQDTAKIVGGVQAERAAKIGAIMGTARKAAADEIAAKNKANREGAEAKIKFMADKKDRMNRNLNKLAASLVEQGINPDELSKEELDAIVTSYGTTAEDIKATYASKKFEQEANQKDTTFTLSEGQARYDAEGNIIASRAKTYAPKDSTTRTADYNKTLLGGGWSGAQIDALEAGIEEYGLQEVIAQEKANGATPAQIKALEQAYKVEDSGEQFLTQDYFKGLMSPQQLEQAAADAGYIAGGNDYIPFNEGPDTEGYLASLETMINAYREAGYTDKEILKMMQ